MRAKKFKRKLYKKIPILFLSLIISIGFIFVLLYSGSLILSKQNFFVSPLAQIKSSQNINLEELLHKSNLQFSRIEGNAIFLRNNGVVYLDLGKNLPSQISSLQLILSRLTIEGKKFKRLDLRFDKPFIEF